jgi:hypothetical protein
MNTTVISNPTLVSGNMQGIGAANSTVGFVSGVPLTTPPQTPRSTASSVAGTKRDAPESDIAEDPLTGKREDREEGGEKKKRRIAPTPVLETWYSQTSCLGWFRVEVCTYLCMTFRMDSNGKKRLGKKEPGVSGIWVEWRQQLAISALAAKALHAWS